MSEAPNSHCIIDNWSLECAGALIELGIREINFRIAKQYGDALRDAILIGDQTQLDGYHDLIEDAGVYLGALSNVVNALILFDRVSYVRNGFENSWRRFDGFANQVNPLLVGVAPPPDLQAVLDSSDLRGQTHDVAYYCALSKSFGADILLNPLRSERLDVRTRKQSRSYGDLAFDLLNAIDATLLTKVESLHSEVLLSDLTSQLALPSLLCLVLSESSDRRDILVTTTALREDRDVRSLRQTIAACLKDLRASSDFFSVLQNASEAVEDAARSICARVPRSAWSITAGGQLLPVSLTYNFADRKHKRERHCFFMRRIALCRVELQSAHSHVARVLEIDEAELG